MMAYRSTVTEDRVGVGNFTGTFRKGQIVDIKQYEDVDGNPTGYNAEDVITYLLDKGVIIEVDDDAVDNEWYDSEDPRLSGADFIGVKAQQLAQEIADADDEFTGATVTVDEDKKEE